MLLLLPPSEGKTTPDDGAGPVDLEALSHPVLTRERRRVLTALIKAAGRRDATAVLGVSESMATEVARNRGLRTAPAAPAASVYTGVLYAAAGLDRLDQPASARAEAQVRIVSALWGAVSPADRIPAYRLSMGTDLPGLGPLAAAWRPLLARALQPLAGDVVVDCRSAAYVSAWRPAQGTDWLAVRVLRELDGRRTVVSHHAKHTRGLLARHLLTRPHGPPTTAQGTLAAAAEMVGGHLVDVELGPEVARGPRMLTLVVADAPTAAR